MSGPRATIRVMTADWFERLTGFREEGYELTRSRLVVEGDELVSTVNGARYAVGELSLPTLAELRDRVEIPKGQRQTATKVSSATHHMQSAGLPR